MGSSRLPGKVMLDLCGKSVIWHIIERVKKSEKIDEIIIATSINKENDTIREFCLENEVKCYSGEENDVLDRYYKAVQLMEGYRDANIIRITADCPLIDPEIVDRVIDYHKIKKADYTSNCLEPTFPDGLDCEIFTFEILEEIWKQAQLKSEREHVTLYIRNNSDRYRIANYKNDEDLSNLRWTLDEAEDFKLINEIYEELYFDKEFFGMQDVMNLLQKRPELLEINVKYSRNEGLVKSIEEDNLYE